MREFPSPKIFREGLEEIANCFFDDFAYNGGRNVQELRQVVRQLTQIILADKRKPFVQYFLEFLLNLLPIVDCFLEQFFFEFFDTVLLLYDDFDFEIKNSASVLGNSLFDHFTIHIKKINKTSNIVKQMLKQV